MGFGARKLSEMLSELATKSPSPLSDEILKVEASIFAGAVPNISSIEAICEAEDFVIDNINWSELL